VLDSIQISSCSAAINGICIKGKSVKECIDECVGGCSAGYHVQFDDGKSICVPIKTSLHPDLSPIYRLKTQSLYPELNNVVISTFVNTDVFPFPPESANVVFYRDIFTIKEPKTNKTIVTEKAETSKEDIIYMSNDSSDSIQILPATSNITVTQVSQYLPVRYGDKIQFSIPGTSLLAKESDEKDRILVWEPTLGVFHGNDMVFTLIPMEKTKSIGDIVTYGESIVIQYADTSIVALNSKHDYLKLVYMNVDDLNHQKNQNSVFKFVSKMKGYYCENNTCKPVPINEMETLDEAGRYKGVTVERNPGCWGVCNYIVPNANFPQPYSTIQPLSGINAKKRYFIFVILFIVILLILLILSRKIYK
jgi:hypothetical protein